MSPAGSPSRNFATSYSVLSRFRFYLNPGFSIPCWASPGWIAGQAVFAASTFVGSGHALLRTLSLTEDRFEVQSLPPSSCWGPPFSRHCCSLVELCSFHANPYPAHHQFVPHFNISSHEPPFPITAHFTIRLSVPPDNPARSGDSPKAVMC